MTNKDVLIKELTKALEEEKNLEKFITNLIITVVNDDASAHTYIDYIRKRNDYVEWRKITTGWGSVRYEKLAEEILMGAISHTRKKIKEGNT